MTPSIYLIVEPISIIAHDLALSVQDYDDAGTVVVAATPAEAIALLANKVSVRFAFIHADPTGFGDTKLGDALAKRHAVCVFMGDAADRAKQELVVLDRPFSPLTIAALMQRLTTTITA